MRALIKSTARAVLRPFGLRPQRTWPFVLPLYRFHRHHDIDRLLDKSLLVPVPLQKAAVPEGELAKLWRTTGHSHKWHHYFPIYERCFGNLRGKAPKFLEIGVQRGGSLRMWRTYFERGATIVGIDIDPACAQADDPSQGIRVRIGSQVDLAFLDRVAAELGPFDAVVDDGSHMASHIVRTFGHLFGGLAPGGTYLIEDTRATYWDAYRDIPYSAGDLARDLIDLQHAHYARGSNGIASMIGAWIERIEVEDSMLIIHKAHNPRRLPTDEVV